MSNADGIRHFRGGSAGVFHHRLRREESYAQKWVYAQENPVRAGLTERVGMWPYQGTVHELRW